MNSTLMNGLELLQVLADAPRPHSVSELSRGAGLPKSHVHRLLQTLVAHQFVEKDDDRRYSIGVGALRLGHALLKDIPLRRRFLPAMVEGVKQVQLPLTLAMPFNSQAISVAHVFHDGKIRSGSETLGTVLPLRTSALGKLFLAHQPAEKIGDTLSRLKYPPAGPRAHRDEESFRRDLQEIFERGCSVNDEESGKNQASLAVPIHDSSGKLVAGIGLSGSRDAVLGDNFEQHLTLLQNFQEPLIKEPAA